MGPAEPDPPHVLSRRDAHVLPEVPLQRPRPHAAGRGEPGQREIGAGLALDVVDDPLQRGRTASRSPPAREPLGVVVRLGQQQPGHQEVRPRARSCARLGKSRGLVKVVQQQPDHSGPGSHGGGGQVHFQTEPDRAGDRPAEHPLQVLFQGGPLDPDVQLPVAVAQPHRGRHPRRDDCCPSRGELHHVVMVRDPVDAFEREVDVVVRHLLGELHAQLRARVAGVDEADRPEPDRRDVAAHLGARGARGQPDRARCQQLRQACQACLQASGAEDGEPPQRPFPHPDRRFTGHSAIISSLHRPGKRVRPRARRPRQAGTGPG